MNKLLKKMTFIQVIILCTLTSCSDLAIQEDHSRFKNIPDLTQTRIGGAQHGDDQMFCAQVAVGNSLAWLFSLDDQIKLVKTLASSQFMNTSLENGTGTVGVLRGVERYLHGRNIENFDMQYQGWRKHLSRYSTYVKRPNPQFMRNYVGDGAAAWINVGWYNKVAGRDYRRIGGHWITLVGVENIDGNSFYVHDPSPRSGDSHKSQLVKLREVSDGKLTGRKTGLPIQAKGYFEFISGLDLPPNTDVAIVDGVVGLKLANS